MNMNVTTALFYSASDRIFKQSITQLHRSDKWLIKSTQSVSSKAMFEVPSFLSHAHKL